MSGAQAEADPKPAGDDPVAMARRMGWKPRDEYSGPPDKWKPAEDFVADLENPAILRDRYKTLDGRYGRLENEVRGVRTKLEEATSTIVTLTNMTRTAEERAYKRAKAELQAERDKAVASGDTDAFRVADRKLEDLEATKPAAPPAAATSAAPTPDPAATAAVQAFYARNGSWYGRDPALTKEADALHVGLLSQRPDLTVEQNLAEVERRMPILFPDRFSRTAPDPQENPRREEPDAVSASTGGAPPRRQRNARSFDTIPQESKAAYVRYAAQLKGRGDPLTKEEWAADYWSQFEEVP
jgi:hypothetical protein